MSEAQAVQPSGGKSPMSARAKRSILVGSILVVAGAIDGVVQVGGTAGDDVELSALRGVNVSTAGDLGDPFDLPPELLNSDFLRWNLCERDFVASVCTEVEPEVEEKDKKKEKKEPPRSPEAQPAQPAAVTYPPPSVAPTVLPAGQPGDGGAAPLAFTGLRLTLWLAIAVALALAGLAVYVVGRRRGSA